MRSNHPVDKIKTTDLPENVRLFYDLSRVQERYYALCLNTKIDLFHARATQWWLPNMTLTKLQAAPMRVQRTSKDLSQRHFDGFHLLVQKHGISMVQQYDQRVVLRPDDHLLLDARRPFEFVFPQSYHLLCLDLPLATIGDIFHSKVSGLLKPTTRRASRALVAVLDVIANDESPIDPDERSALEQHIIGLLFDVYRTHSSISNAYVESNERRVIQIMAERCTDCCFDLDTMAMSTKLARRTIQKIFQARKTTFTRYLRKARIERAVAMMRAPQGQKQSITDVALACGFHDLSMFCKAFSAEMGLSARTFRKNLESR